jgi:uncharacterized membrane protein
MNFVASEADHTGGILSEGGLSRRTLIKAGAAISAGLLLSIGANERNEIATAAEASGFAPDAFVRIDRDGRVALIVGPPNSKSPREV